MAQQLYRLYDAADDLLYIGISYSAIARFAQHRQVQPWIEQVATVRIETHDVGRSEIERMEVDAIARENPRYNIKRRGWVADACPSTPAPPVPPVSFANESIALHRTWHRALDALGCLAMELDQRFGADGTGRESFVSYVAAASRALVYGDCCAQCGEIRYPSALRHESTGWAVGTYICVDCIQQWTCGWSTEFWNAR
ncbi:MAG: hypothetical protein ACO3S5_11115 [Ilumatobacteraceae bacterium]